MSFIEREKDKLNALLRETPSEHPSRAALELAQQALSWALEPDGFMSPTKWVNKFCGLGNAADLTEGTGVQFSSKKELVS